jgi:hypothetical protein
MHRTCVTSFRAALGLVFILVLGWTTLAHAGGRGGGRGFHGGRGGTLHGGVQHHGGRSHSGFKHHQGFHNHRTFGHHHRFGAKAFIGVAPLFLWSPGYIYTYTPPLVAPEPVYIQPSGYWYYCSSARAYYPYVTACAEPWILVPAR